MNGSQDLSTSRAQLEPIPEFCLLRFFFPYFPALVSEAPLDLGAGRERGSKRREGEGQNQSTREEERGRLPFTLFN